MVLLTGSLAPDTARCQAWVGCAAMAVKHACTVAIHPRLMRESQLYAPSGSHLPVRPSWAGGTCTISQVFVTQYADWCQQGRSHLPCSTACTAVTSAVAFCCTTTCVLQPRQWSWNFLRDTCKAAVPTTEQHSAQQLVTCAQCWTCSAQHPSCSCRECISWCPAAQTPVGVMLEILEDILNGQDIDVASVQQLHKLIVTGDFMSLVSVFHCPAQPVVRAALQKGC